MQKPPALTDRTALTRNRARALGAPAFFLRDTVMAEVQERLLEVNRTFTNPAIVTPFPHLWADVFPMAQIVADTPVLTLESGAHDLVIHDLCLHWADDPIGQMIQACHAMRPDGMFIATLFGGQTLQELRRALGEAETQVTGGLSPRVAPMAEIRDAGALLQRAGLALPVADSTDYTVTYPDALALMRDLRAMGEGNALAQRLHHPTRRSVLTAATALYAEHFSDDDGRIRATFEIVTLTGWAPAPNQQQPLRPGTARARLADALRVPEQPL